MKIKIIKTERCLCCGVKITKRNNSYLDTEHCNTCYKINDIASDVFYIKEKLLKND